MISDLKNEKEPEEQLAIPATDPVFPPELDSIIETFRKETLLPMVILEASRGKIKQTWRYALSTAWL